MIAEVSRLAQFIAGTEFVPKSLRDSPAATAAAILYGREVGLPPMTALTQTHVIEGKPSISAEGMRALVLAAGHELEIEETNSARCTMRGRRRGTEKWLTLAWSTDDARQAGLLGRGPWKSYPRAMLQARATTELCRLLFPDVIRGFRSVEELEDLGEAETFAPTPGGAQASTKVTRARKVAAQKAPAALGAGAPAARPAVSSGPPLPGEDGYEDPTPTRAPAPEPTSAGGSDDGPTATHAEELGHDSTTPPTDVDPDPAPDTEGEAVEGAGPATTDEPHPTAATRAQARMIFARLGELGVEPDDREERLAVIGGMIGRTIESQNDLRRTEAKDVIEKLGAVADRDELYARLDQLDKARAADTESGES